MTKVIFVGEMYYSDLTIGGGPIIPPVQPPQPPLGIWGPTDPRPSQPIARPPWGWGSPNPPPGWGQPPGPVDPGYSPPWARPPVDPGYNPPGIGPGTPGTRPPIGGVDPGFGNPWFDPHPSHPIYFPPANLPVDPGYSPPWAQVPDLPPTVPPAQGSGGEPVPVAWKTGWTPGTGWVVVGVPTGPVPTPSQSAPAA